LRAGRSCRNTGHYAVVGLADALRRRAYVFRRPTVSASTCVRVGARTTTDASHARARRRDMAQKSSGDPAADRMTRMQTCVAEIASGLTWRADGIRSVAWTAAVLTIMLASGASTSGCGSAASGSDGGTDAGSTFHVDISLTTGLIAFPNEYSGWSVGGGSATNYVAYPSGWSVGGGSSTNFIAVPPGWSVGGGSATNFVAYGPGWSVGGGSSTNFVAVPPGWTVGGGSATNFVAYPALSGWSAGGGSATNFTALPPGWSTGGGSATNFIAVPPGWSVGGGSATNFVGYPSGQGWTVGGGSATNFTALPPGWSAGGGSATNFVAVPPGWVVGGGSATNFITYPGPSVTTIQVKFDDPGWLGCSRPPRTAGATPSRRSPTSSCTRSLI